MDERVASLRESLRERLESLGATRQPRPAVARPTPKGFTSRPTPDGPALVWEEFLPGPASIPEQADCAYFDTETTGLSGAAGTLVFAAAIAWPRAGGLEVAQFLLREPGHERPFLGALAAALSRTNSLATYNGSRFDLPMLRNRFLLAGMPDLCPSWPHLDLLDLSRSLLRRSIGSCALRNVEERLLHFERQEDLPSYLVPDAYFAYLRWGAIDELEAALAHNRQDVVSLYYLHRRLAARLGGETADLSAEELLALGRHQLRQGLEREGVAALSQAVDRAEGAASGEAGILLARLLVRSGSSDRAAGLLARLEERLPGIANVTIARARILEWRLRDFRLAMEAVEAALGRLPPGHPGLADLQHRSVRLRRRLARARA